ncbi:MAG: protein kinase, partial [Planctomycetaceae bacterium]|nr:protein kinase [Planctomycetaceae bacterium]
MTLINVPSPAIPSRWSPNDIVFDRLCDQFEDDILTDKIPEISVYLDQAPASIRPKLFRELLILRMQIEMTQQNHIPLRETLDIFPQFEAIIFDIYKQYRPSNVTIINKIIASETNIPSEATIGLGQAEPLNIHEVVQIGKYSVLHHIDSGGQGDVFLARHPTLRKNVVIKLSRTSVEPGSSSRDRLIEEGRLLAKLNHRNLVRVIDLDFHEQHPFLVMDYLEGPTLREFSKVRPLEPATAVQWVIDLCHAITEAHNNSIIHRDIKPRNIVVVNGIPTLIDFGLAISTHDDPSNLESGVAGTISYMSPEQTFSSQSKVGPATDVFGLGTVLFYLLENQSPLRAANPNKTITAHDARQFDGETIAPLVSNYLCHKPLVRALANQPANRYNNARQFAEALSSTQPSLRSIPIITKRTAVVLTIGFLAICIWGFRTATPPDINPVAPTSLAAADYEIQFNLHQQT